jgi:hypothetical protein
LANFGQVLIENVRQQVFGEIERHFFVKCRALASFRLAKKFGDIDSRVIQTENNILTIDKILKVLVSVHQSNIFYLCHPISIITGQSVAT